MPTTLVRIERRHEDAPHPRETVWSSIHERLDGLGFATRDGAILVVVRGDERRAVAAVKAAIVDADTAACYHARVVSQAAGRDPRTRR